jgi:hypothetical protein
MLSLRDDGGANEPGRLDLSGLDECELPLVADVDSFERGRQPIGPTAVEFEDDRQHGKSIVLW